MQSLANFRFPMPALAILLILMTLPVSVLAGGNQAEQGFKPLFDGKTLNGWVQRGGEAKYTVTDGIIVGTSVPDTPNSFLCTDRDYADFVLELEFKVDPILNSGVQIRSQVFDKETNIQVKGSDGTIRDRTVPAGRVHGYQVEIDPSDRAWTGGIYDEARRGWLFDLKDSPAAQKAFRQGEWNHFKIEAIGSSIKTWLNGVPAATLDDDMTLSGFIALQVHGVGNNLERVGKTVSWRNVKIKEVTE
jgi:hypothetical protein